MAIYQTLNSDSVAVGVRPSGVTNQSTANWLAQNTQYRSFPNGIGTNQTDASNAQGLAFTTIAPTADVLMSSDFFHTTTQPVSYATIRSTTNTNILTSCYVVEFNDAGAGGTLKIYMPVAGVLGAALVSVAFTSVPAGEWYRVGIQGIGSALKAYLYRWSNGQWLQTGGTFSTTPAFAAQVTNAVITAAGYSGISVYQGGAPRIYADNLQLEDAKASPSIGDVINPDNASIHSTPNVVRFPGDGTAILMEKPTQFCLDTNSTSAIVRIDTARLTAIGLTASSWPNIYFEVDGAARIGPFQLAVPASGSVVNLCAFFGLSGAVTHHLRITYDEISGGDTYNQNLYAILSQIVVDTGATVSTPTGPYADPILKGILFGDSVLWASVNGAINANPYYNGWAQYLGYVLDCWFGCVGKPGQGWSHNSVASGLAILGKDSFPNFDASNVRTYPQTLDFVGFTWGQNDGATDVTADVTAVIQHARTLYGPTPKILCFYPFTDVKHAQIAAGLAAAGDSKAYAVSTGITFPDPVNNGASSSDNVHPNTQYHLLGGVGFGNAVRALMSSGGGGGTTIIGGSELMSSPRQVVPVNNGGAPALPLDTPFSTFVQSQMLGVRVTTAGTLVLVDTNGQATTLSAVSVSQDIPGQFRQVTSAGTSAAVSVLLPV